MSVDLILLIAGLICFGIAAAGIPTGRVNMTALGLLLVFARGLLG